MSPWLVCSTARRAGVDSVTAPLCHRTAGHDRPGRRRCSTWNIRLRPRLRRTAVPTRLPLRSRGRRSLPGGAMTGDDMVPDFGFLRPAVPSPEAEELFADDRRDAGYVMNISHAWAHQPGAQRALMDQLKQAADAAGLSFRQRGVLVAASAVGLGDPHCSLAWGRRLAGEAGDDVAAAVLRGELDALEPQDRA